MFWDYLDGIWRDPPIWVLGNGGCVHSGPNNVQWLCEKIFKVVFHFISVFGGVLRGILSIFGGQLRLFRGG